MVLLVGIGIIMIMYVMDYIMGLVPVRIIQIGRVVYGQMIQKHILGNMKLNGVLRIRQKQDLQGDFLRQHQSIGKRELNGVLRIRKKQDLQGDVLRQRIKIKEKER
jgi:hypothetical protein